MSLLFATSVAFIAAAWGMLLWLLLASLWTTDEDDDGQP